MRVKNFRYFVGDFETTVFDNQTYTEVWASACVELWTEDVKIFHSIAEQFEYFVGLNENICCYYHNLKFDGAFWLSYLMKDLQFKQAYIKLNKEGTRVAWIEEKNMQNNTFKYMISEMGQWYTIIIKVNNRYIEIRDSLKMMPFSVNEIGQSFQTKHKKLDMEYKGFRYAGCQITDEEKEYIANDVLVVKEALEIMFNEGHKKLTIGSCCLTEYTNIIGRNTFKRLFPNLYEIPIDKDKHKYPTAGEWLLKSYRGGWCYLVKGKENKLYHNGTTADVNSLYPSVMSSESGNRYPTGEPTFWKGNYIPPEATKHDKYFFIRIKTRFYIKHNYLPFIQIKHSLMYRGNECLESSDYYNPDTGHYCTHYLDIFNNKHDTRIELTLTMTDYYLILEHYELVDFEIIDGCYFNAKVGIFDDYIEKYKQIKLNSKGAKRTLAKLFLNNLYGKMATSTNSSFKLAYLKEDKSVGFIGIDEHKKKPGYIAVGSAITSYARNFTIRAAQLNYNGIDKAGFIYADTDSIHCDLQPDELVGVVEHPKNFCCWKFESCWDTAIFARQKTYIEHITKEDREECKPYYSVKCAGMPQKCKDLFIKSLEGIKDNDLTEEEQEFVSQKRTLNDFTIGLKVPGKLLPKRIPGGVVLTDTYYEMR